MSSIYLRQFNMKIRFSFILSYFVPNLSKHESKLFSYVQFTSAFYNNEWERHISTIIKYCKCSAY